MSSFVGIFHSHSLPVEQHLCELTLPESLQSHPSLTTFQQGPLHISIQGRTPLLDASPYLVLLSGTIENQNELLHSLPLIDPHSSSLTIEQIIASLYEIHKEEVFFYLKGNFVVAIFNKISSELLLARDRLGEKTVYWTFHDHILFFSTHLKTILSSQWVSKELDMESLSFYMSLGYIPQEKTLIKDVYKLQPGHYLRYADGVNLQIRPYWSYNASLMKKEPLLTNQLIQNQTIESWNNQLSDPSSSTLLLQNDLAKDSLIALLSSKKDSLLKFGPLHTRSAMEEQLLSFSHPDELIEELKKAIWHLEEPDANPEIFSSWLFFRSFAKENVRDLFLDIGSPDWIRAKLFFNFPHFHSHWTTLRSWIKKQCFIPLIHFFQPKIAYDILRSLNTHPWHKAFLDQNCLFSSSEIHHLHSTLFKSVDPEIFLHRFPALETLKASPEALLYLFFKTCLPPSYLVPWQKFSFFWDIQVHYPFFDIDLVQMTASLPRRQFRDLFPLNRTQEDKHSTFLDALWKLSPTLYPYFQGLKKGILVENKMISQEWIEKKLCLVCKNKDLFHQMWGLLILEIWLQTFVERKISSHSTML